MTSQLFAPEQAGGMAPLLFGQTNGNHRYKLPLLPGEQGTKSGGDWVPGGMQSATNLAGSISETRALGEWERERTQLGLAMRPDLYQRLTFLVRKAELAGVDFAELREQAPELRKELEGIHAEARAACKANAPAIEGTNHHDVWEMRAATGQLLGTPEVNERLLAVEELLERRRLQRVPGLSERVVRNTAVNCAGKFDDVLLDMNTGQLYMADLKTKRKQFWTWLEIDTQLAIYARADWMLPEIGATSYEPGPLHHVDQSVGVVLHCPSDGSEPMLRKADLEDGWRNALLARQVCDARSRGKSAARMADSFW